MNAELLVLRTAKEASDSAYEKVMRLLPTFKVDCDRECKAVLFKAGYSHPVKHSEFCKHHIKR
jgi:hypothetical protein